MKPTTGTITITRGGTLAAHWTQVIDRCERGEGKTLKSEDGASVLALPGESGSAGLIVKRWELRTFGARLKSFLYASRAWRHWRGADRLTKAGVRTAACYAIAQSHDPKNGVKVEWLIMDRLQGKTLLQHMADRDLTVEQEHALADAIGKMLADMELGHIYNRDGKPSNWIVCDPLHSQLAVIDTVDVRRSRTPRLNQRLVSLIIEPIGCNVAPRRALCWRVVRSMTRSLPFKLSFPGAERGLNKTFWKAAVEDLAAHGDPTPKVSPLALSNQPSSG